MTSLVSRGLIITLALAMIAACLGSWIGVNSGMHPRRPASLHEFVHHELKLSEAQDRQLDAIEARFAVRRAALDAEIRSANAALAAALQADHAYSPQVAAAGERSQRAIGALQTATIQHVLDMRGLLTPDQAVKFDARIAKALTEQTP
jgi:Spy/CpxP family protein refolding chaperone